MAQKPMIVQKPRLKEMVLTIREQGFDCPENLPRQQVERRYYLTQVAREVMKGRPSEQKCFGKHAEGESACIGCTVNTLCKEMKMTQEVDNTAAAAPVTTSAAEAPQEVTPATTPEATTPEAPAPDASTQEAPKTEEAPKPKKPRKKDTSKLDEFGFRDGTAKSKIAAIIVAHDKKPRREIVEAIKAETGLNDKAAELRFHNVKGAINKKSPINVNEEGDDKVLNVVRPEAPDAPPSE